MGLDELAEEASKTDLEKDIEKMENSELPDSVTNEIVETLEHADETMESIETALSGLVGIDRKIEKMQEKIDTLEERADGLQRQINNMEEDLE